ncbi:MAG TPA: MBL fold metallo-hydrolase [Chitinophaga sp.]|uniref:MBL fold metallo-hydrolase n=1 Tax=Chitinophaga sp. TaxID=1869181 RepID=UPI002F95CB55
MKKQWRSLSDSENYKQGKFENLSPTPMLAENASYGQIIRDQFKRPATIQPSHVLPSVKTNLAALHSETPVVVWFGHSSYLIHCKGVNILVDPVFSGRVSPIAGMMKAYPGTDVYKPEDMPAIDLMIITHNHYDHLNRKTLTQLKPKTTVFYTPLGVGRDIADCFGNDDTRITEMDWWETESPMPGITLTAAPARHFSGRGLRRGTSLWSSFVLQLYGYTIYIGGDSGYDTHFKTIGEKYGPMDLAILECGQYDEAWPYIHMMPDETLQAATDLQAKLLLPVHWGKFTLANHPWNEPITRLTQLAKQKGFPVATPLIGEPVNMLQQNSWQNWWTESQAQNARP